MKESVGSLSSPIWLIAESPPEDWADELDEPLDPKHPVRHNIWTPVLENIQSHLYAKLRKRLCVGELFVENAIQHKDLVPSPNDRDWETSLQKAARDELGGLFRTHTPKLVLTFGRFAFEFARRGRGHSPRRPFSHWTIDQLGIEFAKRIQRFDENRLNLIPLLHMSIALNFLEAHAKFTGTEDGNYFDYVGENLAECLIQHESEFPIY